MTINKCASITCSIGITEKDLNDINNSIGIKDFFIISEKGGPVEDFDGVIINILIGAVAQLSAVFIEKMITVVYRKIKSKTKLTKNKYDSININIENNGKQNFEMNFFIDMGNQDTNLKESAELIKGIADSINIELKKH